MHINFKAEFVGIHTYPCANVVVLVDVDDDESNFVLQ